MVFGWSRSRGNSGFSKLLELELAEATTWSLFQTGRNDAETWPDKPTKPRIENRA
jgi:hypothetical protein